jgi:hypothetical protein
LGIKQSKKWNKKNGDDSHKIGGLNNTNLGFMGQTTV